MNTRLLANPTAAMAVAPSAPTTTWLTKLSTSMSTNSRLTGTAMRAISRRGEGGASGGVPRSPGPGSGERSRRRSAEPAFLLGTEASGDGMSGALHGQEVARRGRRSLPRARGAAPTAPPA